MKTKKYLVHHLSEALAQIKVDLGPSALILSTKKIEAGSKLLGNKKILLEVIAGLGEQEEPFASPREPATQLPINIISELFTKYFEPLKQELQSVKNTVIQLKDQLTHLEQNPVTHPPKQEIISTELSTLVRRLHWHGVDATMIHRISNELLMHDGTHANLDQMIEYLMDHLKEPKPIQFGTAQDKCIVFVGPSGAGKTTTLAKIASDMIFQHQLKVVVINLDIFRTGASEQLKALTTLLQIQYEEAHNQQELAAQLNKYQSYDHVLIDTSGYSITQELELNKLNEVLNQNISLRKLCVLPAYLRISDLYQLIDAYQKIDFDHIVLSKLDETFCFGNLLNISLYTKCAFAYFTTGQTIPHDYEVASKERIIDCLLNISGQHKLPKHIENSFSNYNYIHHFEEGVLQ